MTYATFLVALAVASLTACGKTEEVPWCDGTCEDGKPVKFYVERKGVYRICTCGLTSTPPYCDGTHGTYEG